MEFQDVVMRRRAVRQFEDGGVDREVIERIARLAQRTPSAGFSQGQRLVVVTDPARRREVGRLSSEAEYVEMGFGPWISECAAQFIPCVSEAIYHRRYQEPDKVDAHGAEIEWPVPYWWVDIGATMREHHAGGGRRGPGMRFRRTGLRRAQGVLGPARRVHPHRGHAGRAPGTGRAVTEPEAWLGAVRGIRALGNLGLTFTSGSFTIIRRRAPP